MFEWDFLASPLWDAFIADMTPVVSDVDLLPELFAEDMIACELFDALTPEDTIIADLCVGEEECHAWGG